MFCPGIRWGGPKLGGMSAYLLGSDGLLAGLVKLLDGFLVVTEILLAANEDDGEATAEMHDFGDPLVGTCQLFSYLGGDVERGDAIIPSPGRCQGNRESRQQSKSG